MFDVGDSVFYPMHGVGIVESIQEKDMLGERAKYYILRFITSKLTAMVPVASADSVGLRPVIDSSECEKIFEYLDAAAVCAESENWNQRYRDNLAKLKGGDIYDVADVIKCLKRRDSLKGLSAGDRKMLITARQVLSAEPQRRLEWLGGVPERRQGFLRLKEIRNPRYYRVISK